MTGFVQRRVMGVRILSAFPTHGMGYTGDSGEIMKHKRRNFLINPSFQLRFALYISSWMMGLSLMFLLILDEAFTMISDLLIRDPRGPEVAQVLAAKHELFRSLYFIEAGFVLLVFVLSVFVSHRIAGPLYKLNRYMRDGAKNGRLLGDLHFRSGDHFRELAESYNAMASAVNSGSKKS